MVAVTEEAVEEESRSVNALKLRRRKTRLVYF